jgi:hypothetical protein
MRVMVAGEEKGKVWPPRIGRICSRHFWPTASGIPARMESGMNDGAVADVENHLVVDVPVDGIHSEDSDGEVAVGGAELAGFGPAAAGSEIPCRIVGGVPHLCHDEGGGLGGLVEGGVEDDVGRQEGGLIEIPVPILREAHRCAPVRAQ